MMNLISRARHSIAWNTVGGLFYQGLLTGHQLFLFNVVDGHLYGISGALFSLLYLIVALVDGGFKDSLAPFFALGTRNKKIFKRVVITPLTIQATLLIGVMIAILGATCLWPSFFHPAVTWYVVLIFASLVLFEWLNQVCKTIVQLNFNARVVALSEAFTIIGYCTLVWGYYLLFGTITLFSIFLPLLLISIITSAILVWYVLHIYKNLPETSSCDIAPDLFYRIGRTRTLNFFNQLLHTLFSANFLIPFFAAHFGPLYAGTLKLASSIARFITVILTHVFGSTGSAVMAHTKHAPRKTKHLVFNYMTEKMNIFLYGISIFFLLNAQPLIALKGGTVGSISWLVIGLFLFMNLSDNLLIIYEKLFISEEKTHYLVGLNVLNVLFAYIIFSHVTALSQPIAFVLLLVTRLFYVMSMYGLSFSLWGLRPSFSIAPRYLISYVLLALAFRILQ